MMSCQQNFQAEKRDLWFTKVAEFLSIRALFSNFWNDLNDGKPEDTKYVISNLQDEISSSTQNNDFYSDSQIENEIALRASELLQLASQVKHSFEFILGRLVIDLNATSENKHRSEKNVSEDKAIVTIIEIKSRRSLLVKLREKRNALLLKCYHDIDIRSSNDGTRNCSNSNISMNSNHTDHNQTNDGNNNDIKDTNNNNSTKTNYCESKDSSRYDSASPSNMTTQINDTLRSSIICTSTAQILRLLVLLKDNEKRGLLTVVRVKNRYILNCCVHYLFLTGWVYLFYVGHIDKIVRPFSML
jgi:hypothetical protein